MSDIGVSIQFNLIDRLTGGMRNINAAVSQSTRAFNDASRAVKLTEENMNRLSESAEKLQTRMQLAQNFAIVGQQVGRVGNAMISPMEKAIDVAANFEEVMDGVGAVTKGTEEQMAALTRQALDLGSTTQFSAIQAGQGMHFLGMAGLETNEIMAAMPGLLNAAKAGGMDLARTADIASNVLSGFGLEATEMNRVADVMVATFTSANASTEQIGETMKYVAPLGREAGMSLEQTAAMAGLLGDAGIQGSMAGTTLRGMLSKLADPASDATALLSRMNIDLVDMDGNLRSPVKILGELAGAMENMGSGERLAALNTIFDTRAAAGMAKLMRDEGAGGITKFVEALENAEGAAARVATEMGDNAKGSMIEFQSATEGLQIAFATLLLPTLRMFSGIFTAVTRGLTAFTEQHPILAKAVGFTVGGLGVLLVTLGGLLGLVSAILGPWAMMSHAMVMAQVNGVALSAGFRAMGSTMLMSVRGAVVSAGTAIWSFATTTIPAAITGLASMATAAWAAMVPFLPIIAIVAAIAGAAFLIVKYWEPIKGFFLRMWDGIKAGALRFWEALKTNPFFNPIGYVRANWGKISGFLKGFFKKLEPVLKVLMKPLEPYIKMFQFGKGIWNKITGGTRAATAGAMASAAVAGPLASPAMMSGQTPIEQTIARNQVSNASSQVNAPITINAAAGQDPAAIAQAIRSELDARDRQAQARNRGRLYD